MLKESKGEKNKMNRQDYIKEMKAAIIEEYGEIIKASEDTREEIAEKVNEFAWVDDSVTGKALARSPSTGPKPKRILTAQRMLSGRWSRTSGLTRRPFATNSLRRIGNGSTCPSDAIYSARPSKKL